MQQAALAVLSLTETAMRELLAATQEAASKEGKEAEEARKAAASLQKQVEEFAAAQKEAVSSVPLPARGRWWVLAEIPFCYVA